MRKLSLMAGVSAFALVTAAQFAGAQELDVTRKPRPEYDAVGLRAGSFLVYPMVEVVENYDSNIYATQTNETDDWVTLISPDISVRSDWNNHALNLGAFWTSGIYADHSDENFNDYGVEGDGRIDITRAANLFGGGEAAHLHEDRGDPNGVQGVDPTEYDRYRANVGGLYKPNRLGVLAEGSFLRLDYDDVTSTTGALINNDDRDRDIWEERLRASYDVQPGYTAFLQGSLNQRQYDTIPDDNGFDRDSDGYRIDAGMEVLITEVVEADFFVGYLNQEYDDPAFDDVSAPDFGANVLWSVSEMTSVTGFLAREVQETTQAGASSYLATIVELGIDHELMRNVLIGANAGFTNNDYEGNPRDDDIWNVGVNGKYMFTRNFYAGAEATYRDRDSNVAGQSYDRWVVGAMVGAQF